MIVHTLRITKRIILNLSEINLILLTLIIKFIYIIIYYWWIKILKNKVQKWQRIII